MAITELVSRSEFAGTVENLMTAPSGRKKENRTDYYILKIFG
jgi:hypothetical protein